MCFIDEFFGLAYRDAGSWTYAGAGDNLGDHTATTDLNLVGNAVVGSAGTVIDANGGWFHSYNSTGWRNDTYGGGLYMVDATWIRTYGSKSFYHNTGNFRTDGTLQVGGSGATLNVPNGGDFAYKTDLIFGDYSTDRVGINTNGPTADLDVNGVVRIRGGAPSAGKVLTSTDGSGNATWQPAGGNTISGVVTAGNWYRIASNSSGRANAEFTLRDFISGGGHSTMTFRAGISYGDANNISFTMSSHSKYSSATFTSVRILRGTTYQPQYIEVYCNRSGSVNFSMYDNLQSPGWDAESWTAGSLPSGYTSHEYDVDRLFVVGGVDDEFTIDRNGNVGIGIASPTYKLHVMGRLKTTGINETSDIRLKTNIKPISNALENVLKMEGVTYNWKNKEFPEMGLNDGMQHGLIAQELEKIIPELVLTDKDGWKSIEYTHLVPILIEAIKDLSTELNEQKNAYNTLKAQVDRIDNTLLEDGGSAQQK